MVTPVTTIEHVVSNLNIFPTILEMKLGWECRRTSKSADEASFRCCGQSVPVPWDDTLFGQYDMHHGQVAQMRMIRTPQWKLVRNFEPEGQDELYDLADDAGETCNLASSAEPGHRAHREGLARRVEGWMSRIGDKASAAPADR